MQLIQISMNIYGCCIQPPEKKWLQLITCQDVKDINLAQISYCSVEDRDSICRRISWFHPYNIFQPPGLIRFTQTKVALSFSLNISCKIYFVNLLSLAFLPFWSNMKQKVLNKISVSCVLNPLKPANVIQIPLT